MGGIYGGFMEFFPELYETVEFYTMAPKETAGYDNKESLGTFNVIFQSDRASGMIGPAGRLSYHAQWKSLDWGNDDMMWSAQKLPIGAYFRHSKNDFVYRLIQQIDFSKEGGFYVWKIARVTGANGEQEELLEFKAGLF